MEDNKFKKDEIVTVNFGNLVSSNTFLVSEDLGTECLLYHPLSKEILVRYPKTELNTIPARLKDATEKNLDFAMRSRKELGYKELADLEALCMFFVVRRRLTDNQKNILAKINGVIASIRFNNNIEMVMKYIVQNNGAFDDFNRMWYTNFNSLFSGAKPITSKKQRASLFNMAGFLLAELENPVTENN